MYSECVPTSDSKNDACFSYGTDGWAWDHCRPDAVAMQLSSLPPGNSYLVQGEDGTTCVLSRFPETDKTMMNKCKNVATDCSVIYPYLQWAPTSLTP